jgi:acetyl esterase
VTNKSGRHPIESQIHPELRSVKAHVLPTNRWMLAAMQAFLRVVNRLHERRFRHVLTREIVASTDGHPVSLLIIRPEHLQSNAPALLYFHGGSFIMEGAPSHVENAVRYATEAGCVVFFVEYRLAPKFVFPAGFNDCHAALLWVVSNATRLAIDARRIVVGGDSAGGNLAAGVAQHALHEDAIALQAQLLIYPAVDLLCSRASMAAFKDVPPFKDLSAVRVAETYLGCAPRRPLPRYASPIEGNLANLPPAYIETAQFDPLHDQGVEFATALERSGVKVELNDVSGAIHGFDIVAPKSSVALDAIRRRVQFLRTVFSEA